MFSSTFVQVKRVQQENEDLFSVQERNRKLQEELTESETKCADFETKVSRNEIKFKTYLDEHIADAEVETVNSLLKNILMSMKVQPFLNSYKTHW